MKLYAYSRKSRGDTEDLQKHHDILKEYAESRGLPLEIYEEIGSSETLNRPKLNEVRKLIKEGIIKTLLVFRLDRLSRKTTDLERLLKEFQFYNVELIDVNRNKVIDYNDSLGIKMEGVMSDLYLTQVKQILETGRKKAVSLYGHNIGTVPLGYDYNKETKLLEVNKKESIIVKDLFNEYLKGTSANNIATMLNQKGYRTKKSGLFRSKGIIQMLKNEKYIGVQTYNKTKWHKTEEGKRISKSVPKEEWIIYENAHTPIIDKETFEKAQKQMKENTVTPKKSKARTFELTQLVKCAKCGNTHSFYYDNRNGKKIMKTCVNIDFLTGEKCGNGGLVAYKIENYVKKEFYNKLNYILKIHKNNKVTNNSEDTIKKQIKELNKQKQELNKQVDKLLDLHLTGTLSQERYITKSKQIELNIKDLESKINDLQSNINSVNDSLFNTYWEINGDLEEIYGILEYGTQAEINYLYSKYISRIEYLKKPLEINIIWKENVKMLLEERKRRRRNGIGKRRKI